MKKIILALLILIAACSPTEIMEEEYVPAVPPPVIGLNYYQLHQFDFDGQNEKHPILLAQIHEQQVSNGRVMAGTFTSVSNGDWTDASIWDNGIPTITQNTHVIIQDTVYANSIVIGRNSSITIEAPGYLITENLFAGRYFDLTVESGAGLIVRGTTITGRDATFETDGILAFGGTTYLASGSEIINNSDSTYICGSLNINASVNAEKDCDDLDVEAPEIYTTVFGTPLPITLLYQRVTFDEKLNQIVIEWETATEINSDYVVVNWSIDGENWIPIDTVTSRNEPSYYFAVHSF